MLDPNRIVRAAGVRAGHTVVDLFAGHQGHTAFPAAAHAGPDGHVYAVDMRRTAVDSLKGRAQNPFEGTVEPLHAHVEKVGGIPLADGSADVVLLINGLSLGVNALEVVKEAQRLLKSGGRFAVVDWQPYGNTRIGPASHLRHAPASARSICLVSGFAHQGDFEPGGHHWGFVCQKA